MQTQHEADLCALLVDDVYGELSSVRSTIYFLVVEIFFYGLKYFFSLAQHPKLT